MRRTQNEMKSIEEICAVLDQCKVCRLAMNHDGYPYLVPMNFGYEREGNKIYLYFHGANAGTKKELIEKDGGLLLKWTSMRKQGSVLLPATVTWIMKVSAVREMQKLQMIHKSGRIWKKS